MSSDENDSQRIQILFQKLDRKKNGFLDAQQFEVYLNSIEQLLQHQHPSSAAAQTSSAAAPAAQSSSLRHQNGPNQHEQARTARKAYSTRLVKECDKTMDGTVTFDEFKKFVLGKEKELFILFSKIAETEFEEGGTRKMELNYVVDDDDSHIDAPTGSPPLGKKRSSKQVVVGKAQLKAYLKKNRIVVSESDLEKFLDAVDRKNDGVIDFSEWRDFFLLLPHPATNIQAVFHFYNSVADVDFNSDSSPIPIRMSDAGFREHFKYLLAGGIAGAVSRTVTAPLDRLKVLLQTSTQTHRSFSQIVSIKKGIAKIYRDGGIFSFFRGNGLNIIKIMPESALKFYVFEQAKDTLSHHTNVSKDNLDLWSRMVAGGLAGLVSQFVIYPIETVKTRIMSQITNSMPSTSLGNSSPIHSYSLSSSRDSSIVRAVKNLYRQGGIFAFYRGCGPALLGIIPYAGVDLAVFETLKNTWLKMYKDKEDERRMRRDEEEEGSGSGSLNRRRLGKPATGSDNVIPIHVVLACGMFSGSCGAVLMYPLSLVRTRLQAQGTPSHPTYYSSVFDVIQKTYAHEGLVGFYRGLAPTLLKVLPAVSISYLVYERSKSALELS